MSPERDYNDDEIRVEAESIITTSLAIDVFDGIITDDNPSEDDKMTGLDQCLYFLFGDEYSDKELEYLKKKTLKLAHKFAIGRRKNSVEQEIEYYMYAPSILPVEHMPEFLSKAVFLHTAGKITNNNPSPKNGLTGLDQVILHFLAPSKKDYEIIKKIIIADTISYSGGYRRR